MKTPISVVIGIIFTLLAGIAIGGVLGGVFEANYGTSKITIKEVIPILEYKEPLTEEEKIMNLIETMGKQLKHAEIHIKTDVRGKPVIDITLDYFDAN